jgi:hypothetical protein
VDGSSDSAPLLDLSPQVRSDVDRRVAQELGVSVLAWSRMVGGRAESTVSPRHPRWPTAADHAAELPRPRIARTRDVRSQREIREHVEFSMPRFWSTSSPQYIPAVLSASAFSNTNSCISSSDCTAPYSNSAPIIPATGDQARRGRTEGISRGRQPRLW